MPLYRCYFCQNDKGLPGKEFTADKSVCPTCGADGSSPRTADRVLKLETIHFHPPSTLDGIGVGYLACEPNEGFPPKGQKAGTKYGTGEPANVNCPKCKASELYKARAEALGIPLVPADADFRLEPASPGKE